MKPTRKSMLCLSQTETCFLFQVKFSGLIFSCMLIKCGLCFIGVCAFYTDLYRHRRTDLSSISNIMAAGAANDEVYLSTSYYCKLLLGNIIYQIR